MNFFDSNQNKVLSISDRNIKLLLFETNDKISVKKFSRKKLEPGIVESGDIKKPDKLKLEIKSVFKDAQIGPIDSDEVIFILQESYTYIRNITLKKPLQGLIQKKVFKEMLKKTPLNFKDINFSYKIVDESNSDYKIITAAVSKSKIKKWDKFLKNMNISLKSFALESFTNFRSIYDSIESFPTLIVDIGSKAVNLNLFHQKKFLGSFFVPKGGDYITENISAELDISKNEAENKKIKKGLETKNQELKKVISDSVKQILKDIKKDLSFYEKEYETNIKSMILIGGGSELNGLKESFIQEFSGLDVYLGKNLLKGINSPKEFKKSGYFSCLGVALFNKDWEEISPVIKKDQELDFSIDKVEDEIKTEPKTKTSFFKEQREVRENDEQEKPNKENKDNEKQDEWFSFGLKKIIALSLIGFLLLFLSSYGVTLYMMNQIISSDNFSDSNIYKYSAFVTRDLSISTKNDNSSDLNGRLVSTTFKNTDQSYKFVEKGIKSKINQGEEFWRYPINCCDFEERLPINLKWLVYQKTDIRSTLLKKIKKDFPDEEIIINNTRFINLRQTNSSTYQITGVGFVSSKTPIEEGVSDIGSLKDQSNISTSTIMLKLNQLKQRKNNPDEDNNTTTSSSFIRVEPTGLGYLNVRSGAETSFEKIGTVEVGEKYMLLDSKEGWFKVSINTSTNGWVKSNYANKLD